MSIQQNQEGMKKYRQLFSELNICNDIEENSCVNGSKIDDAVSPSDLLSFFLENGVLQEDSIKSAVRTIRQKSKIVQPVRNNTSMAQVPFTKTYVNAKNGDNNKMSGQVGNKSVAAPISRNVVGNTRTRHIALRFFYDGATYSGLAQNVGQKDDKSVERCLFDALLKARLIGSREASNYSRCGRTDRGVSSAGQVVALHLKSAFPKNASIDEDGTLFLEAKDLPINEHEARKVWTIPRSKNKHGNKTKEINLLKRVEREINEYPYAKILNNILPPSIRILGWTPVTEEFSARFSAQARTYRYYFCKRLMNTNAIQEGLDRLVGKHDFRNLCKMDVEKVYNFERIIHSAELIEVNDTKMATKNGELLYVKIVGQAFLWHQIRCIVEILFMIGKGFESPTIITELLDVKNHPGKPSYSLANEKPLVLHDCRYPNLHFGYSVQNLWTVSCQLEKQWEDLTLAATRIRGCIESFRSFLILRNDMVSFSDSKLAERRKKLERRGIHGVVDSGLQVSTQNSTESPEIISWGDCLSWLEKVRLVPCPSGLTNSVHVPLMQRSMGPTYEEKVENLKKSEKRRQKFEENIIKKRKTAEEDKAFYDHKTKQGGAGITNFKS